MAIRIRKINEITIALCAAETIPMKGDIYLDDNIHHALSTKFAIDWELEGLFKNPPKDRVLEKLMKTQTIKGIK